MPLRVSPTPALLNSAGFVLRPVCTRRDRDLSASWSGALEARSPRRTLSANYLIEDKIAARCIGLLAVHRRTPRLPEPIVEMVLDETIDEAVDPDFLSGILATLLAVSHHDPMAESSILRQLAAAAADRAGFWCGAFGVPPGYAEDHHLPLVVEPARLFDAGRDYVGRSLWLEHGARRDWLAMRAAAATEGIALDAVSGFRSLEYQAGIWRRKLDRGLPVADILAINVPPGYSEHHSGRALDLTTPGCGAAEPEFADTAAFAWLTRHAHRFGFTMSFPEDNIHGVMYEPWHWCHQG